MRARAVGRSSSLKSRGWSQSRMSPQPDRIPKGKTRDFQGKNVPKVGRFSEDVQNSEWPKDRGPRTLQEMETDGKEIAEVCTPGIWEIM
jgi:hypothetical protein